MFTGRKSEKKFFKKFLFSFLIIFILFFFVFHVNLVKAAGFIQVMDETVKGALETLQGEDTAAEREMQAEEDAKSKAGSNIWQSVFNSIMKQLAYDAATYIGSGGEGGEAWWRKENMGDYMRNTADNAAGLFIEEFAQRTGGVFENLDICEPDINFKIKIGLGLVEQERPEPDCSFTEMKSNWKEELKSENFLTDLSDVFYASDDLPLYKAFIVNKEMESQIKKKEDSTNLEQLISGGWNRVSGAAREIIQPPDFLSDTLERTGDSLAKFDQWTGHAFTDAAKMFINQLAYTAFQNAMKNLGEDIPELTSPYSGDFGGLKDFEFDSTPLNREMVEEKVSKIKEAKFTVKGDYNILGELTQCPDPQDPQTNNCVIDDSFSRAIQENLRVSEAMEQGYLNAGGVFGYKDGGVEPKYNEAFPHRSIVILKKYRIVPVGWDVAAQVIKDNQDVITEAVTLQDLLSCYDPYTENGDWDNGYGGQAAIIPSLSAGRPWCTGLVDPDWVLKAPQNFCKREGYGENYIVAQKASGISEEESELDIVRKEYCSDEQTCIKENNDGECEYYGYCTEERRVWDFNADSCNPLYNTCQTYKTREGGKVSYLKNTLDYSCDANSVGCLAYARADSGISYDIASNTLDWETAPSFDYFNKNVESCDPANEGCHEFLRVTEGSGGNFVANYNFEENVAGWPVVERDDAYMGSYVLELNNSVEEPIEVAPDGYNIAGETYTMSFFAKNCSASDTFYMDDTRYTMQLEDSFEGEEVWTYYSMTYRVKEVTGVSGGNGNVIRVGFNISSPGCLIDAFKLEKGNQATVYTDYREGNTIYEKLLPEYMEDDCYENPPNNYTYKDNADPRCYDFARKCSADEVGCDLYQEEGSNFFIPAKVKAQNRCPQECVGYDIYIQDETHFSSRREEHFIPQTADSCNAQAVGCEEFTNLDKLEQGGEAREYYTQLRHCVHENNSACETFYTWRGDENEGQQLVSHTLLADNNGGPAVTSPDSSECNEDIYKLPPTDPGYNQDCREFYNREGEVSYHLFSRTISCSEECHAYRITKDNVETGITSSGNCSAAGSGYLGSEDNQFHWDSESGVCYFCRNGGEWSDENQGCIYYGIPGQGQACSAENNGCQEYNGNMGNNVRVLLLDSFENGLEDWQGGVTSPESLRTEGSSLQINSSPAHKLVGNNVRAGSSYVLEFLAKNSGGGNIEVYLQNSDSSTENFNFQDSNLSGEWKLFRANIEDLGHEPDSAEELFMNVPAGTYVDNIKITEITHRYYLIRDSWETPWSCNQDIYGVSAPDYMLGCRAYVDQEGNNHYLHEFDSLCSEESVGCEIMIDTHNYEEIGSNSWPEGRSVNGDSFVYMVYDTNNLCDSSNQGCERFGKEFTYVNSAVYRNVYLKNNPNQYNEILCTSGDVGCEEWFTEEGSEYFRNPGDKVCQYRNGQYGFDWYKKEVKFCNTGGVGMGNYCLSSWDCELAGATCETDDDCTSEQDCVEGQCRYSCVPKGEDDVCGTEDDIGVPPKTLGIGGYGSGIQQPEGGGWVGLCPSGQSGCTEYIDPYSQVSPDLMLDIYGNDSLEVEVEPYTLIYTENVNSISTMFNDIIQASALDGLGGLNHLYYINQDTPARITGPGSAVLRKAVVTYTFDSEVDKSSCEGVYDYKKGCILFYERAYDSNGIISNKQYNAPETDKIYDQGGVNAGTLNSSNPKDSNVLLKVSPDRECDQWLDCITYMEEEKSDEKTCFDIGICDYLDESGGCRGFVITQDERYDHYVRNPRLDNFDNMSGYSKVAWENINSGNMADHSFNKIPQDLFNPGGMRQEGAYTRVYNGSFESYGQYGASDVSQDLYPFGWVPKEGQWDGLKFTVINNPVKAQKIGVDYPIDGASFLKYAAGNNITSPYSEDVDLAANTNNYVSFYVNTRNLGAGSSGDCVAFLSVEWGGGQRKIVEVGAGEGWQLKIAEFNPGSSRVGNIHLGAYEIGRSGDINNDTTCVGQVYVDDVRIEPVLKVNSDWNTRQSCRLYPEDDSLSCYYADDNGYQYLGQRGYCLEYDHYPGNEDACLLWWPVDKVIGQGIIEDNAGYNDRFPLYNCTEVNMDYELLEKREMVKVNEEESGSFLYNFVTFRWSDAWDQVQANPGAFLTGGALGFLGATLLGAPVDLSVFVGGSMGGNDTIVPGGADPGEPFNNCWGSGCGACPFGYHLAIHKYWEYKDLEIDCVRWKYHVASYCIPLKDDDFMLEREGDCHDSPVAYNPLDEESGLESEHITGNWYKYNGDLQKIAGFDESEYPIRVLFSGNHPYSGIMSYEEASERNLLMMCSKIEEVASETGNIVPWANRLSADSEFEITRDGLDYSTDPSVNIRLEMGYNTPFRPYGALAEIDPVSNPYEWDSVPNSSEHNPVNLGNPDYTLGGVTFGCTSPDTSNCSLYNGYGRLGVCSDSEQNCLAYSVGADRELDLLQASEGVLYDEDTKDGSFGPEAVFNLGDKYSCPQNEYCVPLLTTSFEGMRWMLKNLYVKSFSAWKWDGGHYVLDDTTMADWTPPTNVCPSNMVPSQRNSNNICGFRPEVSNLKLDGASGGAINISRNGAVELTFNSDCDAEQIPLTGIYVQWGDGGSLPLTNNKVNERPNENYPHSFSHTYTFGDVYSERNSPNANISCPSTSQCIVSGIRVTIIDNWGFEGSANWPGSIVITK